MRSTKEVKTGTNTNPAVKGVNPPPEELSFICRSMESEHNSIRNGGIFAKFWTQAHLKAFHCVFKFDKKVELPDFWPENVTLSKFYLNEAARDWLKKGDQTSLLASPQLKQRTKQRSAELNICLHNVRSVRNKAKDVNALLEANEISFKVFIEAWITNNSDDEFILK